MNMKPTNLFNTPKILSIIVAVLVLICTLAGLLIPNFYAVEDPILWAGTYSQDIFSLLGVPALIWALFAGSRGSLCGQAVWIGMLALYFYSYGFYGVGMIYTPLYPLYLAIMSLCGFGLVLVSLKISFVEIAAAQLNRLPGKWIAALFLVNVAILGSAWLMMLIPAAIQGTPTTTSSVFVMDLTFAFPLLTVTAIGLLRKKAWAAVMTGPLLIKGFSTTANLVLANVIAPQLGQATEPMPMLLTYAGFSIISAVFFVIYLRNLGMKITATAG